MKSVVVIGGGIAGLVAATVVAKSGIPVVVFEKASSLGGRAATRDKKGFRFNLGPHALYRKGILHRTLQKFGVTISGSLPPTNGGFTIRNGRLHTLPIGFTSLVTTGVMALSAKFEFAKLQTTLMSIDPRPLQGETLDAWLRAHVHHEEVRDLMRMLTRVTTFTNAPARQSAGAAIEQLQLAVAGNVLYLDGGWQTIVDGLRQAAVAAGARIEAGTSVAALERSGPRHVDSVRLADGRQMPAASVIIAAGPGEVDALTSVTHFESELTPVRVATLDLALSALPQPKRLVAFGADEATYFSVHSASAHLAPAGGALIHVSKYLAPAEHADGGVEHELETLADRMQPGWRTVLAAKQFLPNVTVTHAALLASSGGINGRPSAALDAFDNVFVAGDWVGNRGQLSDAAAASGREAGLKACATIASATIASATTAGPTIDGPSVVAQPFRAAHTDGRSVVAQPFRAAHIA
jgi:phytoene dehydrogenase-like protein